MSKLKNKIKENRRKNKNVKIKARLIRGSLTGLAPIHVKISKEAIINQNSSFFLKKNELLKFRGFLKIGKRTTIIEQIKAITPPILLGMQRRMA